MKPSDVVDYLNKIIRSFENLHSSRSSFLAIPDHIKSINLEQDLANDKKFESLFATREYIENEVIELKLFLHGQNHTISERKIAESKSMSPRSMNNSKFHLFYHHNSFNNNRCLYQEHIDFKSLTYKEAYETMNAIIEKQLKPKKFKINNFNKN